MGRMTLKELCNPYGLKQARIVEPLATKGITADPEKSLKEIASLHGTDPMNFLPACMKPPRGNNPLLVLLLLTLCLPLGLQAAEPGDRVTPEAAAPSQTGTAPPALDEGPTPPASGDQTGEQAAFQAMKKRYRQDPTGVRARLGMCRRGQAGHDGGPHRRHRGGEQWNRQ